MKDLDAYFAYVDSLIRRSGAVQEAVRYKSVGQEMGYIRGYLIFADGSRLEFSEEVVCYRNKLHRTAYRYHYMRSGKTVFRYDTAPHHPHVATFPYHKHDVQGRVLESPPVSLKEVLAEIARLLEKDVPGR